MPDQLPRRVLLTWLTVMLSSRAVGWAQPGPFRGSVIDLWRKVRSALTAEDGWRYFEQIEGARFPEEGMFDGAAVSQLSQTKLVVNVDNAAGDATLVFEQPLKGIVPSGTPVRFRGVISSYAKEPYMLELEVDGGDVYGLEDFR